MTKRSERMLLLGPMLLGAIVFLVGINWGLPSKRSDQYLFGSHPGWSGKEIVARLGATTSAGRKPLTIGADVDPNPNRVRPIAVNDTDAERAEILVRYRLYSDQPDEMITFRALSTIPNTNGDPRLYQYGGLWVYPVGVLLKCASLVGVIDVRSDLSFYLDNPEAFARFYLVGRLYVVAFAIVGVWAVFWLARKMTGDSIVATFSAITYVLLPVVINMAHEAKPHLPSAVLILLAIIAAVKYVESASRRYALTAGAICGAAFGMMLTGAMSFIILPAMCYWRWRSRPPLAQSRIKDVGVDLILSTIVGLAVYCITNPFVLIHAFGDRTVLLSNLGNSQAMYRTPMTIDTALHAADLLAAGTSPLVAIIGGLAVLLFRTKERTRKLILITALPILAQFVLLATNKPAEYARFALFLDIALMLCAVTAIASLMKSQRPQLIVLSLFCVLTSLWSIGYVWHFAIDSTDRPTRLIAAKRLQETYDLAVREVAIYADPAPYCLPPVNLFDWRIVLLDPGAAPVSSTDILIRPTDVIPSQKDPPMRDFMIAYWIRPRLLNAPISWAHKPFRVIAKKEFLRSEKD